MMKSEEALRKMIAPSQKRSQIWRSGIIQLMVTRGCDLACVHCSQGSNLLGKIEVMTPGQFEQAVDSLAGYFGVYGLFGGNPCTSKYFSDYCRILRSKVPYLQRGLWSNNLRGKGAEARITFNPKHSNLNVHLSTEAHAEFVRDWPESVPHLKGLDVDSVHSSPWVSMKDLGIPEEERWKLISSCDINQNWSAIIGLIRGELRAFFCEVAYSQAALHQDDPAWAGVDTGLPVVRDWWRKPMGAFAGQVERHCHDCGIPLRRQGQGAITGGREEYSPAHAFIARPKVKDRPVELVTIGGVERTDRPSTDYLPNTTPRRA
jgi:hypothetical protein